MYTPAHMSSLFSRSVTFFRRLRRRAHLSQRCHHNRVLYATDADGALVDGPQDWPLGAHTGRHPLPVQARRASSFKRRQMMSAANMR